MDYYEEFHLEGFERIRKSENGAVYVRYAEKSSGNERKPAIEATPLRYGGTDTASYVVSIPSRKISACVIVLRTSKSTYQAMTCDERQIERFSKTSLESLRLAVTDFFTKQTKAG